MKTCKSPITIPSIGGKTRLLPILLPIMQEIANLYKLSCFADVFGVGISLFPTSMK